MEGKKPLKSDKVKIIDHLGTLYATLDGNSLWKIDYAAYNVWKVCDGKRSVDELVNDLSKEIGHKPEDVRPIVEKILNQLEELNFLRWVD
jgi:hypothetical protein